MSELEFEEDEWSIYVSITENCSPLMYLLEINYKGGLNNVSLVKIHKNRNMRMT